MRLFDEGTWENIAAAILIRIEKCADNLNYDVNTITPFLLVINEFRIKIRSLMLRDIFIVPSLTMRSCTN